MHRPHIASIRTLFAAASFLLLLLASFAHTSAHAQTTQGTILGAVRDSSGAVIPNATVKLTNVDEGTVRVLASGATGDFRFLDVKAGHYTLNVSAPGFQEFVLTDVRLAVRQELRLDAALQIGQVQQVVNVTGEDVSAIQTESPTISGTFTSDDATNLPVNTRASFSGTSAAAILGTLPGVQDDSSGISLQGALPYQTEVTIDGVTVKDPQGGNFLTEAFPSTESISEIRADGVLANAEFGDPGQVVVTTKGGTDRYHGSAFLYYQSSAFDAIEYTFPTTTIKPSLQGKTFGGSFGGPLILPHLYNGHNRTFFYGAYEGWRHPAQKTIEEVLPTAAMKSGDFSAYSADSFTGLVDPATGNSWGTQLPSSSINTIAAATLAQFYPDPNVSGMTDSYIDGESANYQANVDASAHSNQFDVRGDQYFGSNQKFLLWGRFTWKNSDSSTPQILKLPSSQNTSQSRVLRIDTNWSLTPSLVNEGGFGFTRVTSGNSNAFDGKAWTQSQGWQGLQNLFFNGVPDMAFNNLQGLTADRLTGLNKSFTYEYNDTLIWNKGAHTMKFGGDIQLLEAVSPLGFNGADNYGSYTFYTSGSQGLFTGVDFADFLLGLPNQTFYDVVKQDNDGISGHYHLFGQDEWRVNPRLTLTYGVRYELHPGYYDKYGDIGNFDPSVALSGRAIYPQGKQALLAQSFLASANACDPDGINNTNSATINGSPCMPVEGNVTAGFPSGLKKYPHLRFMPRFGFAFRPTANDKWAIRGGFGLYNINLLGSNFYSLTGTLQAQTQQFQNTYNSTTHAIGYQWPQVYAGTGNSGPTTAYGTDYFGTANSAKWKDPYTEQWALSVDHDLGSGYAVRASYIGSVTRQLVWAPDENSLPFSDSVPAVFAPIGSRLFPNWGRINSRETGANESYHSMQVEASHRLQRGLEYHSGFTWAKALADNQGPSGTGFGGESGGARASSILDRHVDYGPAYGTRKFRWNTTALYDLPFGRGKMFGGGMSRIADTVAGGWRLSAIFMVQTGPYETPFFPAGQTDPSGTGSGLNGALGDGTGSFDLGHRDQHPDRVTTVRMNLQGRNRFTWTNPAAFSCPGDTTWSPETSCTTGSGAGTVPLPIGRFGNAGVGSVVGPGTVNLSTGLSKSVPLTERFHLKLEGTFTNVLNHTNLGDPDMNLSTTSFGLITGTIGSDFGGARTGQVSARLEF